MKLHVWGTDFRRSSPEFRNRFWLSAEERHARLSTLLELGFTDLVYVYTCNRVEFYTAGKDYFGDTRPQWLRLLSHFGLSEDDYYRGYHFEGKSALRHLLRVSGSLESMVVGESQVLGQLKDSIQWTRDSGLPLTRSLQSIFQFVFETAKRVRTETGIGEKAVSIASLGIKELERREAENPILRAVVVGRSPMAVTIVQWLQKNRPEVPITWANWHAEKLDEIPEARLTERVSLEQFMTGLVDFSHLFTATSSPAPLFDSAFFERLGPRAKTCFDFAQPEDIARDVERNDHIHVVRMSDLSDLARENRDARAHEVRAAEQLIERAIHDYCLEQKETPIIREFSATEPLFLEELSRYVDSLGSEIPDEWQSRVKKLADKIVKKSLHESREQLRSVLKLVVDPHSPDRESRLPL
jgi:glutamyl-tRNA reductase